MKLRPALLLCGAILIAAMPAWGDRIPYPGSLKESPKAEISTRETRSSVLKMHVPVHTEVQADPTPAVLPIDSFEANNAFNVTDSNSSIPRITYFPSSSDMHIHPANLKDLGSLEHASSIWHAGEAWGEERNEKEENDTDNKEVKKGIVTASVPEPESLSLLLFGLAVIGFSPRQRKNLPLTT